jgi:hypothetical protein
MEGWSHKLDEHWEALRERWATWDLGPLPTVAVFSVFSSVCAGWAGTGRGSPEHIPLEALGPRQARAVAGQRCW